MIPEGWTKLILEFDGYRRLWLAWAIAPASGTLYWFKGQGENGEAAFIDLHNKVKVGEHIGKKPAMAVWNKTTFPSQSLNIDLDKLEINI